MSHDAAVAAISRWSGSAFEPLDYCDMSDAVVEVADSWLLADGAVRGLSLHQQRFADSVVERGFDLPDGLWEAMVATLPRSGTWFPRIDLQTVSGAARWILRVRPEPERKASVVLATASGADPRTAPRIKGPDLVAMNRLRQSAQAAGADEAILTDADGYVVEGATSAIVWWYGDALCTPGGDQPRVASVTERTIVTLAKALGVDVIEDHATPRELDGHEVWVLNSLHGIRIATTWLGGPQLAQQPGRLTEWRRRIDALTRPLP